MNQIEKATCFQRLHQDSQPLVLINCWDAGSALAIQNAGALALATGSHSVAAAHGFEDGEQIPLDHVLWIAERICASTDLPVSIDFEGAYARDPSDVSDHVTRLIRTGAIGMNFEDRVVGGTGLYSIDDQCARIRAARAAADASGIPFFINARTDLFLNASATDHSENVPEAIERASAYSAAGADGIFVPGLAEEDLVRQVCEKAGAPVNVMVGSMEAIEQAQTCPVARISLGPFPHAWTMQWLADAARNAYERSGGME